MSATDPFEVEATTSYRLVMDLGSPHHLLSALAPGQSEHPYHPHFDDGLDGRREEADVSSVGDGRWSRRSVVVRAGEAMEAREQGVAQDWADGALRLVLQPLELAP